jgi:hypothetical protein
MCRPTGLGLVFLHKVRMQLEMILSSANQDLVSCCWDPRIHTVCTRTVLSLPASHIPGAGDG